MIVKRLDDSEIDFSWVLCCSFKERTYNDNLTRAMRTAIIFDVIDYKKCSLLKCNICQIEDQEYSNYHVDHDVVQFKTLMNNFLKITELILPSTFDSCERNLTCFKNEDITFKTEWVTYHTNHRKYQLLCRNCNLTKK